MYLSPLELRQVIYDILKENEHGKDFEVAGKCVVAIVTAETQRETSKLMFIAERKGP